jgi:hypothetical protein
VRYPKQGLYWTLTLPRLARDALQAGQEAVEITGGVVHAEVHRHGRGIMAQHIALEAVIPAGRPVAADAHIAEGQVPRREPGECPQFQVGAVHVLFGDAVPHHHDPVAILEEELRRAGRLVRRHDGAAQGDERSGDQSDSGP